MTKTKLIMCAGLFLASTSLWANSNSTNPPASQESEGIITPYGENPNIFHVFAYKTQEGIINTVSRVGAATERGINKLKPKAKEAQEGVENVAEATGKKLTEAKNVVLGEATEGPAPISQQSLSENSTGQYNQVQTPVPMASQNETGTKTYAISDL